MPGRDRRGPTGMGPLTGKQMSFCTGRANEGYFDTGFAGGSGLGFSRHGGRGKGYGIGNRNYFRAGNPEPQEKAYLENEIMALKEQIAALENQVSKLGSKV